MYVIPTEALGFYIVNSGAVVEEAVYHSNVCLHIHFQAKLHVLPAMTLANLVFCSTL